MLSDLHIKNVAIIEDQTISFGSGLNVISGETGSGKSVILNALEFLLGAKPRAGMLRSGAEELEVQARFDLSALPASLRKELPDLAQEEELSLSRTLAENGRGKVFINGKLATVSLLTEVTGKLVNICGQNQHVRLLEPRFHLSLVDGFGGHADLLARYQQAYGEWKALAATLVTREERLERNALRKAELEFIVEELKKIDLESGIRERLEAEVRRLGRGEGVIDRAKALLQAISTDGGLRDQLSSVFVALGELEKLDPDASPFVRFAASAREAIDDLEVGLNRYAESVELDPESLELLRDRLSEVARLERKYRTNDQGLLDLLSRSEQELKDVSSADSINELREQVAALESRVAGLGAELTKQRQQAGKRLAREVERELVELNMVGARLALVLETASAGPNGCDSGEIYLASNKGEPPRELRKIASGGELSRIMLVLKKILKDRSGVNVLVFDEVDSGVSGSVARAVGQKLKQLAESSQVICITHLAQVASLADHHFLVGKKSGKRTISLVKELTRAEKVEEIARMLAGYQVTAAARESARELMSSKD